MTTLICLVAAYPEIIHCVIMAIQILTIHVSFDLRQNHTSTLSIHWSHSFLYIISLLILGNIIQCISIIFSPIPSSASSTLYAYIPTPHSFVFFFLRQSFPVKLWLSWNLLCSPCLFLTRWTFLRISYVSMVNTTYWVHLVLLSCVCV